jgi:hypothetical protein
MAQVTNTDVFDFIGTPADVRTQQGSQITSLITRVIKEITEKLNREIEKEDFTNVLFENYHNCEIVDDYLFLKGKYRDIFSITSITESGTALQEQTDSDDGKDYYHIVSTGVIKRVGANWSGVPNAIKISGSLGLVDTVTPFDTKNDIKQAIIEMTAAKSGLWKTNVQTEGGDITTIRTDINQNTKDIIRKYKMRDF